MRSTQKTHQPILILDACSTHMGPRFLRACRRWNIWLVFVPAKTTWLLQPADTHTFAAFKRRLRDMFEQSLLESDDGVVHLKTVLPHLDRAIRKVFQGKAWSSALDANGWSCQQQLLRQKILQTLEWQCVPAISDALPTLQQFEVIFPKRRQVPLAALLNHYKVSATAGGPFVPHRLPDLDAEPIASPGPWHGRLRSSSSFI